MSVNMLSYNKTVFVALTAIVLLFSTIATHEANADSVIANIPMGSNPSAIAFDSANNDIYVANSNDGTVSVIGASNTVVGLPISVGSGPSSNPSAIAFDSTNNDIYVANTGNNTVSVISTTPPPPPPSFSGKITGSGEIEKAINFGFDIKSSGTTIKGEVQYHDEKSSHDEKSKEIEFKSNTITGLSVDSNKTKAIIDGTAKIGKISGYTFEITVQLSGKDGKHSHFTITIKDPSSNPFYTKDGIMKEGHIQIK